MQKTDILLCYFRFKNVEFDNCDMKHISAKKAYFENVKTERCVLDR